MRYTEREYKPLRVFRNFQVSGTDHDLLQRQYPAGEYSMYEGKPFIRYLKYQVINIPSDFERGLFTSQVNGMEIPQHPDGYDDPTSGIARSRKNSHKGRVAWERWAQTNPFTDVLSEIPG